MAVNQDYARSILKLDQSVIEDLKHLNEFLKRNTNIREFLSAPIFSAHRRDVLNSICKECSPVTLRLLDQVLHNKVKDLDKIVRQIDIYTSRIKGIKLVKVISRSELPARVQGDVKQAIGDKNQFEFSTDPKIIAGIVIKIDSTVFDYSLAGDMLSVFNKI